MTRAEYIQSVIDKYRGRFTQEFEFENADKRYVEYHYDEESDCLVAECVAVPFHYDIEEINCALLDEKLDELEDLVIEHYKAEFGIQLIVPED